MSHNEFILSSYHKIFHVRTEFWEGRDMRNSSIVKSILCSYRNSGFDSQHLHILQFQGLPPPCELYNCASAGIIITTKVASLLYSQQGHGLWASIWVWATSQTKNTVPPYPHPPTPGSRTKDPNIKDLE